MISSLVVTVTVASHRHQLPWSHVTHESGKRSQTERQKIRFNGVRHSLSGKWSAISGRYSERDAYSGGAPPHEVYLTHGDLANQSESCGFGKRRTYGTAHPISDPPYGNVTSCATPVRFSSMVGSSSPAMQNLTSR